jgi:hypothetical protein
MIAPPEIEPRQKKNRAYSTGGFVVYNACHHVQFNIAKLVEAFFLVQAGDK